MKEQPRVPCFLHCYLYVAKGFSSSSSLGAYPCHGLYDSGVCVPPMLHAVGAVVVNIIAGSFKCGPCQI